MTKPTVYIAGPMTGIEAHNFPAFYEAAEDWRAQGWAVINPAELDAGGIPPDQHIKLHSDCKLFCLIDPRTFAEYMRRDLIMICKRADAIALLHDWSDSPGATLERTVAQGLSLFIYSATWPVPPPPTHPFEANVCCLRPDYAHLRLRDA